MIWWLLKNAACTLPRIGVALHRPAFQTQWFIWYTTLFDMMNNLSRNGVDKAFSISKDCCVDCNLVVRFGIVNKSDGDFDP